MTTENAERASIAGLLLVSLVAAVYLLRAGHDTMAFYDEWDFIAKRRGLSADSLLAPHNGHLSLIPVALYKLLLQIAGLANYWVFRVVLVVAHVACVWLVFLLARPRVGTVGAAFAGAFVAVLGAAGDDLLWGFQIGFVGGVACGLGALLALDRGTRRGDAAAAVLLGLSLAFASVGAAFVIAATVEIALDSRRRERWWVIGAPLALYAAWYLGYGESQIKRDNIGETPVFAAESGAAAAGGVVGLTLEYGRVLLVGLAAVVVQRLWRSETLTPRLVAVAVAAPAIWILTGLSRAQYNEPAAARYIYTGAVLIVLLVCELARGRSVVRPAQALLLGALLTFTAVAGANTIDKWGGSLRNSAAELRVRLGALALVADRVDAGFQPGPTVAPQLYARSITEAQQDFGRIGLTPAQLRRVPQPQGAAADDVLLRARQLRTEAVAATSTPADAACTRTNPTGPDNRLDVVVPEGGAVRITARARAGVLARRFAREFSQTPIVEVPAGGAVLVRADDDAAAGVPWRLQVASGGRVVVCRA